MRSSGAQLRAKASDMRRREYATRSGAVCDSHYHIAQKRLYSSRVAAARRAAEQVRQESAGMAGVQRLRETRGETETEERNVRRRRQEERQREG